MQAGSVDKEKNSENIESAFDFWGNRLITHKYFGYCTIFPLQITVSETASTAALLQFCPILVNPALLNNFFRSSIISQHFHPLSGRKIPGRGRARAVDAKFTEYIFDCSMLAAVLCKTIKGKKKSGSHALDDWCNMMQMSKHIVLYKIVSFSFPFG